MFVWTPPIKHIEFQSNSCIYNVKLQVMSEGDRTNISLLKGELPFPPKLPVLQVTQIPSSCWSIIDKDNLTNALIPGNGSATTKLWQETYGIKIKTLYLAFNHD